MYLHFNYTQFSRMELRNKPRRRRFGDRIDKAHGDFFARLLKEVVEEDAAAEPCRILLRKAFFVTVTANHMEFAHVLCRVDEEYEEEEHVVCLKAPIDGKMHTMTLPICYGVNHPSLTIVADMYWRDVLGNVQEHIRILDKLVTSRSVVPGSRMHHDIVGAFFDMTEVMIRDIWTHKRLGSAD